MARLPNAHHVIISGDKVHGYALNPDHPRGRDKARVFAAALGYTRTNHAGLVERIRRGVLERDAVSLGRLPHGESFRVDIPVNGPQGEAVVRTIWIIREGEDVPRLVTLFVV